MFAPKEFFYLISLACNERCTKCSHWKQRDPAPLVKIEHVINLILHLKSLKEVCLVGGEPLLHKERIFLILKALESTGIRINLVTNGTLADKPFLDQIQGKNIHVVFSIDTLDKEYWQFVRGNQSFETVIKNLNLAIAKLGPSGQLSIQSVLSQETEKHINSIRAFAKEHNLFHSTQDYLQDGFEGSWTAIKNKTLKQDIGVACYSTGKNISVMPNGDVFTCFQQNLIPGCAKPLGNLNQDSVSEILDSQYLNQVISSMKSCNLPCKTLACNKERVSYA